MALPSDGHDIQFFCAKGELYVVIALSEYISYIIKGKNFPIRYVDASWG